MNTLKSTPFGIADKETLVRIINDAPPELREKADASVATLATIGAGTLHDLFPGRGLVPERDDKEGVARTYRGFGEAADFVMRHATNPADRLGAAVAAAEIQNTAMAVGQWATVEGLQYDVFGLSPVHEGSSERKQFIAGIVDHYGLEPDGDGSATTDYIMSHARDWDLHAAERYQNTTQE